jgi:Ni/Co efflux regulator RcnB
MKSILLSGTTALLLMAASGAYAQPDQHPNDQQHPAGPAHPGGDAHPGAQTMSGPGGQHNTMSGDHNMTHGDHGAMSGPAMSGPPNNKPTHGMDNDHRTTTHTTRTTTTNTWNHNNNGGLNHSPLNKNHFNNSLHNRPHPKIRVNLKITLNARHHFRGPTWHPPHGYVYHRYNVGQRLADAFYARDYWLTDFAAYDLIAPPDGYVWVRYGPDALLIDEDSGDVVRVVYGVFY